MVLEVEWSSVLNDKRPAHVVYRDPVPSQYMGSLLHARVPDTLLAPYYQKPAGSDS